MSRLSRLFLKAVEASPHSFERPHVVQSPPTCAKVWGGHSICSRKPEFRNVLANKCSPLGTMLRRGAADLRSLVAPNGLPLDRLAKRLFDRRRSITLDGTTSSSAEQVPMLYPRQRKQLRDSPQ